MGSFSSRPLSRATVGIDQSGTNNDVDVQSSALPTGAATEATLALIKSTDGIKKITDAVTLAALPSGSNTIGAVGLAASASGGATPYKLISAASTNATSVKASAGTVYSIFGHNVNAAVRFLKFYNKASAPTVGTDTPVLTLPIPASTTGAGFVFTSSVGFAFSTGIAFALTTAVADSDTGAVAANEIVVNLGYL